MKPEYIYTITFFVTLLVVASVTVLIAKIFDRVPLYIPFNGGGLPFPNAYPKLPPPSPGGDKPSQCVNFCTDSATGKVTPCESVSLTKCLSDLNCVDCVTKSPLQNIVCMDPAATTNWPTVPAAQKALNNESAMYCLPKRQSCMDKDATVPVKCLNDDDCMQCNDSLPNGDVYKCNAVENLGVVTIVNTEGRTKQFTDVPVGQYCTPSVQGCDPRYGTPSWSANDGWFCLCKYPWIMGGSMCTDVTACDIANVLPSTAGKQQPLLNVVGVDGSQIGSVWTLESGVDPTKCVNSAGEIGECGASPSSSSDVYTQPTVACQCDGMQKLSNGFYMHDSNAPLSCKLDPCFANRSGGRTVREGTKQGGSAVSDLPTIPFQEVTTCTCSGYESSLWKFDTTAGEETDAGAPKWMGRCADFTIPNTSIVIKTEAVDPDTNEPNPLCAVQMNTAAQSSRLVPGINGVTSENTCAPDPCQGSFVDTNYKTSEALGYFDAVHGVCACIKTLNKYAASALVNGGQCDRSVNPVCSYCAYACSAPLSETCPIEEGSNCPNVQCQTEPTGEKKCDCGSNCFYYNNKCITKVDHLCGCEGLDRIPNVCKKDGDMCQFVKACGYNSSIDIDSKFYETVETRTVCHNHSYCGDASCSLADVLQGRSYESCGGVVDHRFADCGIHLA